MTNKLENILRLVIFAGAGGLVIWLLFSAPAADAERYAADIVERCGSEEAGACYEREVPALLSELSLPEIFSVIREVRQADPQYQFCHVLAHKLGENIVAEDPSRWVEAMQYNPPDGLCSNGFIHGVVGGRFRAEVLDDETIAKHLPDFSRACEPRPGWSPTALDQAICYHGMGHLYMFITDADISKALAVCEQSTHSPTGDFRQVCREGVFMQIYQPLEPDDFLLIERMAVKPTPQTVRDFCARYEQDEYEGACLRESWPFFQEEVLTAPGIADFCAGQPNAREEDSCYISSFSLLGRRSLDVPERALGVCAASAEERRALCYAHAATSIIEENRDAAEAVIQFCAQAPDGYANECLRSIANKVDFIFGDSVYRQKFCSALPQEMRGYCSMVRRTVQ
jgi:hypothetical protein